MLGLLLFGKAVVDMLCPTTALFFVGLIFINLKER